MPPFHAFIDQALMDQGLIDQSVDPQRVAQYWRDFQAKHGDRLTQFVRHPERARWLGVIFSCSRFLAAELLLHPEWLDSVCDLDFALSREDFQQRLERFPQGPHDLALFRRHELLRIVLRDRLELAPLSEITEEISNLADAILDCALRRVKADLEARYGQPMEAPGAAASFCVLALGKLGGRELNYSSDIDLLFLYSGNGETTGPQVITNNEFFKKVASQYVSLLSTYTVAGQCYRVDLRLRPEGNLGEVVISLAAAKEYYAKRARAWELQMLIKARVCVGDTDLGRELLNFVEPAIYSTTDDFSTIEAMSATRERIGEKLARRRRKQHEVDVKLSRGGIRDVEFLVQCLQRLHGAREVRVRHGSTLQALTRLHEGDLLSGTEYWRLASAYEYFRHLEHLLQLEDDRQTHSLPSNPAELERIAWRMLKTKGEGAQRGGISVAGQLLRDLNQHLENVQVIYERIVHAQRPLQYAPTPQFSAAFEAYLRLEENNASIDLAGDFLRDLARHVPNLAERLRTRGVKRSDRALTGFLDALIEQPDQLQLLDGRAVLTDWMLQIFELSPYLADQLTRYPYLLEEIRRAADHPTRRWAFEGLAAPLTDIGALRRFFRREMFRIQVTSVCLPEYVFATLDNTSALAEFVIARAYRIALEGALARARAHSTAAKPFHEPQNEMMIVAVGRLGMREFDLASDADLLFILPDSESGNHLFWTRVAEHLIEILTSYTGDGTILSLDTRLRPNGREGLLVQTESAYVEYFSTSAKAWEGIAYMKARALAGDTERATQFLSELQQVDWRRYGQGGRSKSDLHQMRLRLQREQAEATPLKASPGGYYDADFILMYLRLRGAGMFFKSLNTPERIDVLEKMGHLDRFDAEFLLIATTYFRALDHAIRLVTGRSEEKIPAAPIQRQMIAELLPRWTGHSTSAAKLDTDLSALQKKMRQVFEGIFVG
jgi:glutamate-ammonia-ligase adenylyltransferase